jgi:hypothetical protein
MSATFEVDHSRIAADPALADFADQLDRLSPIDSVDAFNRYSRTACRVWRDRFPERAAEIPDRFRKLRGQIDSGAANVIKTRWGGVVVTLHKHPRVEKFLVVDSGHYLALEKHEQKVERLESTEGTGLVLWRNAGSGHLLAELFLPSGQLQLSPGFEHCLIGLENLVVFERSIDPKGMDQDLIFIYEPN